MSRLIFLSFVCFVFVCPVNAGIVIDDSAGSGPLLNVQQPWSPGGNSSTSQTAEVGNTGLDVTLMSNINITNQGANTIEPVSGNFLAANSVLWTPVGFTGFGEFSVNVNYISSNVGSDDVTVEVEYLSSLGAPQTPIVMDVENTSSQRIFVDATMGEIITQISIRPIGTAEISSFQQTRVSAIPEPSAFLLCRLVSLFAATGRWRAAKASA